MPLSPFFVPTEARANWQHTTCWRCGSPVDWHTMETRVSVFPEFREWIDGDEPPNRIWWSEMVKHAHSLLNIGWRCEL